jgi:hypothetical protein
MPSFVHFRNVQLVKWCLRIGASSWIVVPMPYASELRSSFETLCCQPGFAKTMHCRYPTETRTNHQCIHGCRVILDPVHVAVVTDLCMRVCHRFRSNSEASYLYIDKQYHVHSESRSDPLDMVAEHYRGLPCLISIVRPYDAVELPSNCLAL